MSTTGSPMEVLAHGSFADSSSWNGVIGRLQAERVPVTAAAFAQAIIDVNERST